MKSILASQPINFSAGVCGYVTIPSGISAIRITGNCPNTEVTTKEISLDELKKGGRVFQLVYGNQKILVDCDLPKLYVFTTNTSLGLSISYLFD